MDGYDDHEQMKMMLDDVIRNLHAILRDLEDFKAGDLGYEDIE